MDSNLSRGPARRRPAVRPVPRPRPALEFLEARDVPSASVLAVGADAGGGPRVSVIDRATGATTLDFFAYDQSFTGGVRVAVADFNGDGTPDVVTAPGAGIAAAVKVFDGKTGNLLQSFTAFDPAFTGGANVAVGDVTGDGKADIVVGVDSHGGPRVQVYDPAAGAVVRDFFAYAEGFLGGVRVAAGDVTGDGKADIVTGAGAGGGPQVNVFDGVTGNLVNSFFAYASSFTGGVNVAAADLTADGKADIITGTGAGGGPQVNVFSAAGDLLNSFFAYDPSFTGGVRVGAFALDATGRPGIVTIPGVGGGGDVRLFSTVGGVASSVYSAFTSNFRGGGFAAAAGLPAAVTAIADGVLGNFFNLAPSTGPTLVTLNLNPLDVNLLGLHVTTDQITVKVSVDSGDGKLLGNLLTVVSNLVNLQGVNNALNNVLGNVVTLLNSADLNIDTGITAGSLTTAAPGSTPVLDVFVAPVHLDLLGARVDTSPIHLKITADSGDGLILGNALTSLTHLFDPPLPDRLDLPTITAKLNDLLARLNAQLPGLPSAPVDPVVLTGDSQVLRLTVPPIDVDLLGLVLKTSQIKVNADALVGSGNLLGNVVTTLLNTLGATPQQRTDLSNALNGVLAKVIGVLNASHLTLPPGAVDALTPVLKTLALPNLVNTTGTPATTPVLNLSIASTDGQTPPVDVDLLGLKITTSNVQAQLAATTGDGQVLGNLTYNVAHLLDPGGSLNLLTVLNQLAL